MLQCLNPPCSASCVAGWRGCYLDREEGVVEEESTKTLAQRGRASRLCQRKTTIGLVGNVWGCRISRTPTSGQSSREANNLGRICGSVSGSTDGRSADSERWTTVDINQTDGAQLPPRGLNCLDSAGEEGVPRQSDL